jgi:hypothetical protein
MCFTNIFNYNIYTVTVPAGPPPLVTQPIHVTQLRNLSGVLYLLSAANSSYVRVNLTALRYRIDISAQLLPTAVADRIDIFNYNSKFVTVPFYDSELQRPLPICQLPLTVLSLDIQLQYINPNTLAAADELFTSFTLTFGVAPEVQ